MFVQGVSCLTLTQKIAHMSERSKVSFFLPLIISISVVLGMFVGFRLRDGFPNTPFFERKETSPFQEVLHLIETRYVDDVSKRALGDSAIESLLSRLDPHSVYIPAAELEDVNDEIRGLFYGIGVEFALYQDTVQILQVLSGGPAQKAGLKTGDQLLRVDQKVVSGVKMQDDSLRALLRGRSGQAVMLHMLRDKQSLDFRVLRGMISMNSIESAYMIRPKTGYIRVSKFTSETYREFMEALTGLKEKGMQELMLDLRGNGGGMLSEAVEIADEFLSGDKLITYTQGKHQPKKEYRCKRLGLFETGKLVVLCDEESASASEIILGAMQDWKRATIIGQQSFGKGLVQEQYDLQNGAALRLTVARYYTPNGRSIQRPYNKGRDAYYNNQNTSDSTKTGGIRPDVWVSMDSLSWTDSTATTNVYERLREWSYRYVQAHPELLNDKAFKSDWSSKIQIQPADWQANIPVRLSGTVNAYLNQYIKALIGRMVAGNEMFFIIMNSTDPYVQAGLSTMK